MDLCCHYEYQKNPSLKLPKVLNTKNCSACRCFYCICEEIFLFTNRKVSVECVWLVAGLSNLTTGLFKEARFLG